MKKTLILVICLLLLVGCKDKRDEKEQDTTFEQEHFVINKKDENKDYVVLTENRNLVIDNKEYVVNNLEINLDSDDVANINLEIKTFVNNSMKKATIKENVLERGNVISYDYYVTSKYISVVLNYYFYVRGVKGEEKSNVYIVSLVNGKIVSNSELLNEYDLDENKLYKLLEDKIEGDDVLYTISNIKNYGYSLYVNNENKLCIIYNEITDEESMKKELVLV